MKCFPRILLLCSLLVVLISPTSAWCASTNNQTQGKIVSVDNFMFFTSSDKDIMTKLRNAYTSPAFPQSLKGIFTGVTNQYTTADKIYFVVSYVKKKQTKITFDLQVLDDHGNTVLAKHYKDHKKQGADAISSLRLPFCGSRPRSGSYTALLTVHEN